ncbi:HNH endonuclease [Lampropedia aestuarii]|uniref:HNH endonuclease n=1 Tax=Lampropedia aestuarii TaxID=2562762 RepID=A0A4S5BU20_9BURK|nr:HNH endonuclease signature motif containing protein [Lampropedia aestuarii]THJ36180.1 HNH endonuclease [Lampropedia aestuarii]
MSEMEDTASKKCSKCQQEKPRSAFYKCIACLDGLRGECKPCVAAKQKLYNKENAEQISTQKKERYWEDPEKRRAIARKYAAENVEAARARAKARYWANRDRLLADAKAYVEVNRERVNQQRAQYRLVNRNELRQRSRLFYRVNKERLQPGRKAAKAMRRGAEGVVTKAIVEGLLKRQRSRCVACLCDVRRSGYHLDHITPLSKGGTNAASNLQILCPPCNLSKSAKHPVDFMQERGWLI